nr:immunoglobulin light chain junction region [Macaca mulatta]MOW39490.1 immunoglobulin light chain junction region [Macaca mulatta]MOW39590.1 immunoglobulin light chain junction region [Macaca mulatta]MOW39757.1 immunoglobulin light chain junction region [Macaca mulatta]MOW39772.1 immunoglobulin light chain junction region [Macaca mulatta]
CQQHYTYPYTF